MSNYFLIVYDRASARITSMLRFVDRDAASAAKVRTEVSVMGAGRRLEVVVLEARNEEHLFQSHARYFREISDLKLRGEGLARKASAVSRYWLVSQRGDGMWVISTEGHETIVHADAVAAVAGAASDARLWVEENKKTAAVRVQNQDGSWREAAVVQSG